MFIEYRLFVEAVKNFWILYFYRIKFKMFKILGFKYLRSSYGLNFVENLDDLTFRYYILGTYGRFYWDRLSNINYPFVFIDIGANQGLYSICSAKNPFLYLSYSFEPVEETFIYLNKNIYLNDVADKCISFNLGVSNTCSSRDILIKKGHSGAATFSSLNMEANHGAQLEKILTVDANKLDEIIVTSGLPVIVKVDVEGVEDVVIEQLMKCYFAPQIKEIFVEINENWVDLKYIRKLLYDNGFNKFKRNPESAAGAHYDLLVSR